MKIILEQKIEDGFNTKKFAILLDDNNIIEAVSFKKNNHTICLSSQVGCSVGCVFCESGKNGLIRNLTAKEIFEQYELVMQYSEFNKDENGYILFMGIGEPLLNYDCVKEAVFNIKKNTKEKIIISTVGIKGKIDRIIKDKLDIDLCVSLHATNQDQRDEIIPISKMFNYNNLLSEIYSFEKRGKRTLPIDINYLLFKNFNDFKEDALQLVDFFRDRDVRIVVKEPCPISNQKYFMTSSQNAKKFIDILKENNINHLFTRSTGREINAGCGQLKSSIVKNIK
ncbi:radical SAM protein [archaeon]|nr:radical SAM protein [archaeon]MCK9439382.1 radical SAM protein [Patescibacteria group bacterium]